MTSRLLLLSALFSIVPLIWAKACATPGFVLSGDQNWCFAFSQEFKPWNSQSMLCRMYGARLVTITDASKETQVRNYISSQSIVSTRKIYIGATNIIGTASDWIWSNVGDVSYTNWRAGDPIVKNGKNCVVMPAGNPDYKWYSYSCLWDYSAICERPATAVDRQ